MNTRSTPFATALVIVVGLSSCSNSIPYIGPPDRSAVGTYELAFCRHSCNVDDSAASVVRGFLVLDSVRIVVPDSQKEYFDFADAGNDAIELVNDHPHTGCFALHEPGRPQKTLSGAPLVRDAFYAVGLNNWRYRPDSTGLEFELYRSIDASFGVNAQLSGGRLVGIASAGGMSEGADKGIRHVAGKRIGGPQPARCFAAAPVRWSLRQLDAPSAKK